MAVMSIDVKNVYYFFPHDQLLACVQNSIDSFGSVMFQNSAGLSVEGFLELLHFYQNTTYAEWNNCVLL